METGLCKDGDRSVMEQQSDVLLFCCLSSLSLILSTSSSCEQTLARSSLRHDGVVQLLSRVSSSSEPSSRSGWLKAGCDVSESTAVIVLSDADNVAYRH